METEVANTVEQPTVENDEVDEQSLAEQSIPEQEIVNVVEGVAVPAEEPVQPEMPAPGFRLPAADELTSPELDNVVAGIPTSPEEQRLFAQMANMAAMGQAPVSDNSTLEAYGLSEEGNQKVK